MARSTATLLSLTFLLLQLLSLVSLCHSSTAEAQPGQNPASGQAQAPQTPGQNAASSQAQAPQMPGQAPSAQAEGQTDAASGQGQTLPMLYHHGQLLSGSVSLTPIWYGNFTPTQRAILTDFLTSVTPDSAKPQSEPSVASWWKTTQKYYAQSQITAPFFLLEKDIVDENYSLGKSLKSINLVHLAWKGKTSNAINIVLTSSDVTVEGFCSSRCGTHGSAPRGAKLKNDGIHFAYIWVGNSESQCAGMCAWPFAKPLQGPPTPPLMPPSSDVGVDGMIINLASLLAGTATNPYGNGFYQGPKDAPLEAASACPGVFGKGAYPGYAGEVVMDNSTGASYNANGANGRKFLLPVLFDLSTSTCLTQP